MMHSCRFTKTAACFSQGLLKRHWPVPCGPALFFLEKGVAFAAKYLISPAEIIWIRHPAVYMVMTRFQSGTDFSLNQIIC